jgi:hypothetical protein
MTDAKHNKLMEFFDGKDVRQLMSMLKGHRDFGNSEEKETIAKLREGIRACAKEKEKPLFTYKETFSFSTKEAYINALVSYLKDDIKGKRIVDATCGIGKAVIGLSSAAKEVIGIEIDEEKAILAEQNIKYYGITNARIIHDDATSERSMNILNKADIIFVDPQRAKSARSRVIDENSPGIDYFTQNFKEKRIIYEISPMIPLDDIPMEASILLFSHHKRHARTVLLFGFYGERRIIVLNEKKESFSTAIMKGAEYSEFDTANEYNGKYIVDIDETLAKSGMIGEIEEYGITKYYNEGKLVFSIIESKTIMPFCDTRKIIFESSNEKEVMEETRRSGIGKILLRYSVPSEMYSKEAKKFSSRGDNKAYLYMIKGRYYICLD